MVTFFQKTSVSLRKKAITIASPQKFDHRSSQSVAFLVALQSKSLVDVNKGLRVHSMGGARCDCQKTKSNRYNEFPFGFAVHIKVRIHQKCLPIILSLLSQMIAPINIWTSNNLWFVEMCTDPLKEIFLQIFRMTITTTKYMYKSDERQMQVCNPSSPQPIHVALCAFVSRAGEPVIKM